MNEKKILTRDKINCPVEYAVSLLSGKFKIRILNALMNESGDTGSIDHFILK